MYILLFDKKNGILRARLGDITRRPYISCGAIYNKSITPEINEVMKILIEASDNKADFAMDVLKSISFVKKAKRVVANEITNTAILQSIEDYEKGKVNPAPVNLNELKDITHA